MMGDIGLGRPRTRAELGPGEHEHANHAYREQTASLVQSTYLVVER